ncbi:MAG: cytochrome C oxidase subunit IV family protein [bacterium]
MAEGSGAAHGGGRWYQTYVAVWVWLLAFTIIEVGAVAIRLDRALLVTLLLLLSLMKAVLIVAYFMHLRYERLTLIYLVLTPLILILVLFGGVVPDALNAFHLRPSP